MKPEMTRRGALAVLGTAPMVLIRKSKAVAPLPAIQKGPFQATRESLKAFRVPDWFRDAKLGLWAHWGPQSAPEQGDWYARLMYEQGSPVYQWHLEHFGHPSKVGFKDVIPTFNGDKWDPEHLMDLYVKAGAKYFVSMGVHHDNFDMWNSKYHPRWNAAASGPRKDIVGMWRDAARKRGLRFGVSEHLSNSFDWLATAHRSDKTGPLAGVPYDGTDPAYAGLYHSYKEMPANFADTAKAMGRVAPESWKLEYFNRIKDLIDQHQPDLLYTDGGIPFEEYGLGLVAHHYNVSAKRHGGRMEAIYTSKVLEDCAEGTCALDLERGVADKIMPDPWQTDTCIGAWHYKRDITYKTPKVVVDMLVDIVSRNGNLLLNFPLPGSGALDDRELAVLSSLTDWMAVNNEGIYATRPWKIFGEGPGIAALADGKKEMAFNEGGRKELTAADVRFTAKGKILYTFVMGWPQGQARIKALGTNSPRQPGKVRNVEMLGYKGRLNWSQQAGELSVDLPPEKPSEHAVTLKVTMA
ncbi:MAG: alpha-L-fucosidase [Acidobacteriia bacterium]|nr:alpha-L-fucosidase [Terriglobia bacterium]